MNETNNIKHIIQIIIEIIYTLLGLDKINNKPIEFSKSTNSENITNDANGITFKQLIDHIMKSYNDFMGIEGLTNNTKKTKAKEGLNNKNIEVSNINSAKVIGNKLPNWAKTSN